MCAHTHTHTHTHTRTHTHTHTHTQTHTWHTIFNTSLGWHEGDNNHRFDIKAKQTRDNPTTILVTADFPKLFLGRFLSLVYLADGEVSVLTYCITASPCADTDSTSPNTDSVQPCTWQGSHWSTSVIVTDMAWPRERGATPVFLALEAVTLSRGHWDSSPKAVLWLDTAKRDMEVGSRERNPKSSRLTLLISLKAPCRHLACQRVVWVMLSKRSWSVKIRNKRKVRMSSKLAMLWMVPDTYTCSGQVIWRRQERVEGGGGGGGGDEKGWGIII